MAGAGQQVWFRQISERFHLFGTYYKQVKLDLIELQNF